MRPTDTCTPARDVQRSVASPGHAITRRCDGCRRFTTQIEGSSWFRKILWHCPTCTTARRANTEPTT
jgi:hypothetical protein